MDLETACHDLREPGIIDEKMLYNAIIEQGPKGEEGRLYKQQGIVYEQVTHLRLQFMDILKIDHLWMMTGLTTLKLSNNVIEKIENLDVLVNLKELNLSFNHIERIENLDCLLKLEVLTLFQNKIQVLENLDHLKNLKVLSVGNNNIADFNNILYLRPFECLKSLNLAGNPVCEDEQFLILIAAFLPQLVYYEYRMITKEKKSEAREAFSHEIDKLEREEDERKQVLEEQKKEELQEILNAEAFVEYLGGPQLFLALFEKDSDCKTLLKMGDVITDVYLEFKQNFTDVTKELHAFGLNQLELRKAEMERYKKFVGNAKEKAFEESRKVLEEFVKEKDALFVTVKDVLGSQIEDDERVNDISLHIQVFNETFRKLCHRTWITLMKNELNLFEAAEEVNGVYERAMTELVNQFVEGAQAHFTQLRQLQNTFNETIVDVANKFFTSYTVATAKGPSQEYKNLAQDLVQMLQDKEVLMNALSASHDYHLLVIDQREDKLMSGIKNWLSNLVENVVNSEINRNRSAITEINHFLDVQKDELQQLIATPMLFLPKELQDAF